MVIMEEVTAFQENELFAFTLDAYPLISDVEVKFTGDESKTEITATNHVEGKNLLWKGMLRIMKSMLANRWQEQYDKLKENNCIGSLGTNVCTCELRVVDTIALRDGIDFWGFIWSRTDSFV